MASYIEITVINLPTTGQSFTIRDELNSRDLYFEFDSGLVFFPGKVLISSDKGLQAVFITKSMNNYYNQFDDYTWVIDSPNFKTTFYFVDPAGQWSIVNNLTGGNISLQVFNDTPISSFNIDSITIATASIGTPCDDVEITVNTTPQADNITSPISQAVSSNPFVFETARGNAIDITMDYDGVTNTYRARIPLLLTAYLSVEIETTPGGGLVTVNRLFPLSQSGSIYPLIPTYEYKIDSEDWQTSNSWSGISTGAHTVYVRDNIGCEVNIPITIPSFSANLVDYDPVFEISNANAFRFKKNEVWDNECGILKNVENTLSFEEPTKLNNRSYLQPFQQCDIVQNQIKTNYETVTAKLIDCDGVETALTVVKMTDNLNVKDVRDGKIFIYSGDTIGIYFQSGNTYDPDTLLANGSYNTLGLLMDWVNIGDYIYIQGYGWAKITNIISPTISQPYYLAITTGINSVGFSNGQTIQITTIYNVVDFDRHEFLVDFATKSGSYYIKVNGTDSNFPSVEYISEWIDVKQIHEGCHLIQWYATRNNEINYGTGITFSARFKFLRPLRWSPKTEQEIYVTDTRTINLDAKVREFYELNLMPLPTAMAQKVILILAHNRIFIDGQSYLLEGDPEVVPYGSTNLYTVKANMVKTDYVFDATQGTTASEILLASGTPLAIDENAKGLLFIE